MKKTMDRLIDEMITVVGSRIPDVVEVIPRSDLAKILNVAIQYFKDSELLNYRDSRDVFDPVYTKIRNRIKWSHVTGQVLSYQHELKNVTLLPYKRNRKKAEGFHLLSMGAFDINDAPIESMCLVRGNQLSQIYGPLASVRELKGTHIYGGLLLNHFGHFLLESLARIHHIKNSNLPFVWVSNRHFNSLCSWQTELLQVLGINLARVCIINEPTKIESLIDCEPGFELRNYFLPALHDALVVPVSPPIIGRFESEVQPSGAKKKVWLSRSLISDVQSKVDGETDVENVLKSLGWTIFHPEQHSILEQIEVISSASILAGFEGSAFHLLILLDSPACDVVIFSRNDGVFKDDGHQFIENRNFELIRSVVGFRQFACGVKMRHVSGSGRKARYELLNVCDVVEILQNQFN